MKRVASETERAIRMAGYNYYRYLGQGLSGKVYKVSKKDIPSETYALKVFDYHGATKEQHDEGTIMRGLNHENIVKFCGYTKINGVPGILMELVEMGSLEDYRLEQPLNAVPVRKRRLVMQQLLLAVSHLQSKGIVHGDIREANVLMKTPNKFKLCDFGLSIQLKSSPDSTWENKEKFIKDIQDLKELLQSMRGDEVYSDHADDRTKNLWKDENNLLEKLDESCRTKDFSLQAFFDFVA